MPKGVYPRADPSKRFWSCVDKDGPVPQHCKELGACWVWAGGKSSTGYGGFWLNGKTVGAHVASWLFEYGTLPKQLILHSCDNRACVRPSHLFEGTHQDNMADMKRKGRGASGEKNNFVRHPELRPRGARHGMCKFSDAQIAKVKELLARRVSQYKIAEIMGMSQPHVSAIKTGRLRA